MGYRSYQGSGLNSVWIIIALNFAMFIGTIAWGKAILNIDGISIVIYKAHYYLGLMPADFLAQPWTIISNLFVHAGYENFWHILVNMLTFYFFGTYLSRLVGQSRFLGVYFGGGILGNIFYILMGEPFSIAIGASGAIFALAGALVMMVPNLKVYVFPVPTPMPLWVAVIGIFAVLTALAGLLHIAWQAHLGGLVAGLVAGYFFRKRGRYSYIR
jgi:membrane associated rhomboid family serine protease